MTEDEAKATIRERCVSAAGKAVGGIVEQRWAHLGQHEWDELGTAALDAVLKVLGDSEEVLDQIRDEVGYGAFANKDADFTARMTLGRVLQVVKGDGAGFGWAKARRLADGSVSTAKDAKDASHD